MCPLGMRGILSVAKTMLTSHDNSFYFSVFVRLIVDLAPWYLYFFVQTFLLFGMYALFLVCIMHLMFLCIHVMSFVHELDVFMHAFDVFYACTVLLYVQMHLV